MIQSTLAKSQYLKQRSEIRDSASIYEGFQRQMDKYSATVFWYLVLGFAHELVHWLAAAATCYCSYVFSQSSAFVWVPQTLLQTKFWFNLLVGRKVELPILSEKNENHHEDASLFFVQHAAWIASLLIAIWIEKKFRRKLHWEGNRRSAHSVTRDLGPMRYAAWVVVLEAMWTDLLEFPAFPTSLKGEQKHTAVFYCGNFGIILLHHVWWTNEYGNAALDILEKMVQVTMMRGAQSGGVVCFHPTDQKHKLSSGRYMVKGTRTRILNMKRTDLSASLRRKVYRDNCLFRRPFPKDFVPVFTGHTRFATSSKATFEGTHPHMWTPSSPRRVYDMSPSSGVNMESQTKTGQLLDNDKKRRRTRKPLIIHVENYVTHNGDFDYYRVNGKAYGLEIIQKWLVRVLHHPMPSGVDSNAIAGMIDVLRTQGCFGLSARYAICLALPTSHMDEQISDRYTLPPFPPYKHFEKIGNIFENILEDMLQTTPLTSIDDSPSLREVFAWSVVNELAPRVQEFFGGVLSNYIHDGENGASLFPFCLSTINAFFDNDLFQATKQFMGNAIGSFGLCVTSSLDAQEQMCIAARGQPMSVAFFPRKGLILYASEQSAVKAGLQISFPPGNLDVDHSSRDVDKDALRLDLDDLGGEVMLVDYSKNQCREKSPVSAPNRHIAHHEFMNGKATVVVYKESKVTAQDPQIYHRMIRLSRNKFIKPLPEDSKDLILQDIRDIPRICSNIQDDWHSDFAATSLNRLTAHTLSRALRKLLEARVRGERSFHDVDVLLTGCEVSLWLAEQFASDLQKSFPKLSTLAVSSNKLLGLFGQDVAVPSFGFPYSPQTYDLQDTIVIIVSHSGSTFAPLSCCNLFQSSTREIFAVTSEWDTQLGKQLRAMDNVDGGMEQLCCSRIFSTEVGLRPAEPCSLSVVATHQLLTNLFEYISVLILSDMRYRHATAATISEQDLQILERCNRENLHALTEIVGMDRKGNELVQRDIVEKELRAAGDLWADHILENARAYIMSIAYILATVISGYPLAFVIAHLWAGLDKSSDWMYVIHTIDAFIYIWLPQINITILRLIQGRNLRHRMVGRTVVIGDIPWVAQAAEAFLSKIFAVSYSIASLNVLSGNPADHFVHRHTHRVVRGTLFVCGRPDGRLSALSSAEAAVCLAFNQTSSIQSHGGVCESISIGHNPFPLPLSVKCVFLKRKRPLFFCERLLLESDAAADRTLMEEAKSEVKKKNFRRLFRGFVYTQPVDHFDPSLSRHRESSVRPRSYKARSAAALLGSFRNFEEGENNVNDNSASEIVDEQDQAEEMSVDAVVAAAIEERKWSDRVRNLFEAFDLDNDGLLREEEYVLGWKRLHTGDVSEDDLRTQFQIADEDDSGSLNYAEFHKLLMNNSNLSSAFVKIPPSHRDRRGLIQIEPSREKYFGEMLRRYNAGKSGRTLHFTLARGQEQAMQLYESRIGSLQRFVSMVVMFHQMGRRVERFFARISFGMLAYRMDRTHSIMRIATTATPVSGSDVRQQMHQLRLLKRVKQSVRVISRAWLCYKERKNVRELARKISSGNLRSGTNKAINHKRNGKNGSRFEFTEDHETWKKGYEMNGIGNTDFLEDESHGSAHAYDEQQSKNDGRLLEGSLGSGLFT